MTPVCAGCLGALACWVCLGTGAADTVDRGGTCSSCGGTALCRYCRPEPVALAPVGAVPGQRGAQRRTDRQSTVR